jgi:membrane protease YdiL (CAAX protease family)
MSPGFAPDPAPSWGAPSPVPPAPRSRYWIGVVVTVVAILSQYFVPEGYPPALALYGNLPGDLAVVYGVPIVAFALLVGRGPLRNGLRRMGRAAQEGLAWYGVLSLLALLVLFALLIAYQVLDPSAIALLKKQNPALTEAAGDPWLFVALSFLVGACEETIFRGWIFGYWRDVPGSWIGPATWTSVVFAGMHLYYGLTYGAASPLIFPGLFLTGFAFAATYRYSGGNLAVVALLHGENDASAYLTLPLGVLGDAIHYAVILAGAAVAFVLYLRRAAGPAPPPAG